MMEPKHWIKELLVMPVEEMAGAIGDAFDMGFEFRRREDGLIAIHAMNEDFEFFEHPFMIVRDERDEENAVPQWRFVFLAYLTSIPATHALKALLLNEPPSSLAQGWAIDQCSVWFKDDHLKELGWKADV